MQIFEKSFTRQEAIDDESITAATEVLRSGRLHRYNTDAGEASQVDLLEQEFRNYIGTRYALAVTSCGFALQTALRSVGVGPGDSVLCNSFTLAPVPGAIENTGARTVLVETGEDLSIDADDLAAVADETGARFLLLSYMRGNIGRLDDVLHVCRKRAITIVEDCAHTLGARWKNRKIGTFGAVSCFSTQTYKHLNSGEGGFLCSSDPSIMARAVLHSGSYMFHDRHRAAPSTEAFEDLRWVAANYSGRMDNLRASILRPQLRRLDSNVQRWNILYQAMASALVKIPGIEIPRHAPGSSRVGSSIQFYLQGRRAEEIRSFVSGCADRGVLLAWFGADKPERYTSRYDSWRYISGQRDLPRTRQNLDTLCDMRLPLTFDTGDCGRIAAVIAEVVAETGQPGTSVDCPQKVRGETS